MSKLLYVQASKLSINIYRMHLYLFRGVRLPYIFYYYWQKIYLEYF